MKLTTVDPGAYVRPNTLTYSPRPKFTIRDGRILGPNDELLLWVPLANRSDLQEVALRVLPTLPSSTDKWTSLRVDTAPSSYL